MHIQSILVRKAEERKSILSIFPLKHLVIKALKATKAKTTKIAELPFLSFAIT